MNILRAALGHYEPIGSSADADCVIGHSFGTNIGPASVNRALAEFVLMHNQGWMVIADRTLANAFPEGAQQVDEIIEGPVSSSLGRGVGSWGTLVEAKSYMLRHDLKRPLMVAQACHIGRVAMQANRLEISSIVPLGLPALFDRWSAQPWTRSRSLWLPREVFGSVVLKFQHKL